MNAPRTRVQRRPVHGVLLLDKPLGLSSNDALAEGQVAAAGGEGRPHRHAGPAGHRRAAAVLRRGDQVQPAAPGCRQDLRGGRCSWASRRHRRCRRRGDRRAPGAGDHARRLAQVRRSSPGRSRQVPPMHSALKKDGKACTNTPAPASRSSASRATSRPRAGAAPSAAGPLLRSSPRSARAPTSARWAKTSARRWAAARTCFAAPNCHRAVRPSTQCVTLAELEACPSRTPGPAAAGGSAAAGHTRVTLGTEDAAGFLSGLRRRGAWADQEASGGVFGEAPAALLGTGHVKAGELIPGRLLSPIEIQQILRREANRHQSRNV
jgi:tRNA pseudouridine55 synthase